MDWRDEGILIAARRHGESSAIVEVFTAAHGRHAGVVRGGAGRRMAPVLQPGARLSLEWSARLEEHIGTFRVDPIGGADRGDHGRPGGAGGARGDDGAARGDAAGARRASGALRPQLATWSRRWRGADWPARYAAWELALLAELGFGLDLAACAVTGRDRGPGLGLAEVGAGGQPGGRGALGGAAAAAAGVPARRLGRAAGGGGGGGGAGADRLLPRGARGAGAAARRRCRRRGRGRWRRSGGIR